ncbi:MAG: tetratricopeptide repeat protein [Nitrospirae bacterium]|nr:tetratricopeptide repeat protein [Nitrospirota bacterium]
MVASLRRMGVRAFGTDVSAYSVGQAPGEAAPYLHVGSAAALPFADASFDLVAGIEVLEHVPEERVAETLTEIRRVCRGAVFLTVANTTATQPHDFFKDLSHVTMKPLGWWQERMREAGFDLVDGELPIGEFLGHQLVARVVPPAAAGETPAESSADDPVKALCAEAAEALKRGDADGARRLFVRAASEGGHTAEPYLGLGAVAIHESSYDEARQSYEKALELAAEDPRPLFGLGLAHWGGGEKETALECFVRAASRDADNPALVYHLVQAAHAAGKLETAVEPLERYLGLHPADSDLLLSYAGVCARLGRRSDAEEALSRLKLVAPDQDGLNDLEKTLEETAECRA